MNAKKSNIKRYIPILITKRGERRALLKLGAAEKKLMTPLFVVAPIDWSYENGEPSKTVDEHLRSLGSELAKSWGKLPAFLDLIFIDDDKMADGTHPLEWVIEQGNHSGANLIPTVSPNRPDKYKKAAANVIAKDKRGVCIRLESNEWPSTASSTPLFKLIKQLSLSPAEVDLVLDLGKEIADAPKLSLIAVRNELLTLPNPNDWRSITVAGAGFPERLSDVAHQGFTLISRLEWIMYKTLLTSSALPRVPNFGDYVIAHPNPTVDIDPKFMNISAAIRYTVSDAWLISKGKLFKGSGGSGQGGAAAVPPITAIVKDPRFAGSTHCTGDTWLDLVASGTVKNGGNPETWRREGTVHHLTYVAQEVANLP